MDVLCAGMEQTTSQSSPSSSAAASSSYSTSFPFSFSPASLFSPTSWVERAPKRDFFEIEEDGLLVEAGVSIYLGGM